MIKKELPEDPRGGISSLTTLLQLFRHIRPHWKTLIVIQSVGLLLLALNSSIPFSLKYITEKLQAGEVSALLWLPPLLLALVVALELLTSLRTVLSNFISLLMGVELQDEMFDRYMAMRLLDHFAQPVGEKMARITFEVSWIVQGAMIFFSSLLFMPLMILTYLGIMIHLDWKLAALSFVSFPVVIVISGLMAKVLKKTGKSLQHANAGLNRYLADILGGISIVKAFRREDSEQERFSVVLNEYLEAGKKDAVWQAIINPVSKITGTVVFCIIAWYAFNRITVSHDLVVPNFVAFASVLVLFNSELRKISQAFTGLSRAAASYERIQGMLDKNTTSSAGTGEEKNTFENTISIENVSFAYHEAPVLRETNLEVRRGSTVALTGISGAGKTTMLHLILGLLSPADGIIRIDGTDIDKLSRNSMRSIFSYVPQSSFLFDYSIRDNIAYGKKGATMGEIEHAARLAVAEGFIKTLRNGYDTQAGNMGEQLSAGQRQRIAIARALMNDAPVILLDECFSNLDAITEGQIYQNLNSLSGKTLIVVTHRLSTIRDADMIYHFEAGRLVEQGTHSELLAMDGAFKALHDIYERFESRNRPDITF